MSLLPSQVDDTENGQFLFPESTSYETDSVWRTLGLMWADSGEKLRYGTLEKIQVPFGTL